MTALSEELARARRLIAAHRHLLEDRISEAAAELGTSGSGSIAEHAMRAVIRAREADTAGRIEEADALFRQVAAVELPLSAALVAAASFFAKRGNRDLATECSGRAGLCGYGAAASASEAPTGLPVQRLEQLKHAIDQNPVRYLGTLCALKHMLLSKFSWVDAITGYAAMFADRGVARLNRLPLVGLQEYAKRRGQQYVELVPERDILLRTPAIVGQGQASPRPARARSIFCAALSDVVVGARSTLLETPDAVLYDFQARELADNPTDITFDPIAFEHRDDTMTVVRFGGAPSEIPEAISLVGSSSIAFGHWLVDYLLKLFTFDKVNAAVPVPILVDAGMPPQHREALEFFSRGEHPIIELPPFSAIRVGKLWVCATFAFMPIMPKAGPPLNAAAVRPQCAWLLELLGDIKKPERPADEALRRLFWARRPTLKRKLVNLPEIEEICRQRGFVSIYPEDLSFEEQLWLVHNATHIVGPCGSAMLLPFFYGAADLKMLELHPGFLEAYALWTSVAEMRGQEVRLILGDVVRRDPYFRENSDYRIDSKMVGEVLDGWGLSAKSD